MKHDTSELKTQRCRYLCSNNRTGSDLSQILAMADFPIGENTHIRIMPDAHAGADYTIGATMKINDKTHYAKGDEKTWGTHFVSTVPRSFQQIITTERYP